jgi:hypothetical protein
MYSGHASELGTGMGDASGVDGEADVEGLFGSILNVVKSVAAPAATFVGGAVGTVIAPGAGTAVGAYLGGKLGGALASSGGGGGGGGAPAPTQRFVARPSAYSPSTGSYGGPSTASRTRYGAHGTAAGTAEEKRVLALMRARRAAKQKTTIASKGMSTAAKVAAAAGGLGAAALGTLLALRGRM